MTAPKRHAHLIANTKSGKGAGASLPEMAKSVAAKLHIPLTHYPTDDPATFEAQIAKAVKAASADGGIVIAAGGDGTLRSVAHQAADAGVPFGAVPCGTFNFFARNHRLPEDPEASMRIALTGEIRPVRLGWVNGQFFLINASFGLYAKSIQEREQSTKMLGRARLVVILSTMRSLLQRHRHLAVELVTGGKTVRVRTLSVFVGNNALQLRDLALNVAHCMKKELLAVVVLKPVSRWEMLRIFWRGISKTLEREERLETFCVDSLLIRLPHRHTQVALDGEIFTMTSPLRIESRPQILQMALPPKGSA